MNTLRNLEDLAVQEYLIGLKGTGKEKSEQIKHTRFNFLDELSMLFF